VSLLDDRPGSIDRLIRKGNAYELALTFEDSLAGRSFTSTLDDVALDVTVVDDVMTITASAAITGALTVGVGVEWLLIEDIAGVDQVLLVGTWTPDDGPRAGTSSAVTVAAGASQATVTVPGAGAVAALDTRVTAAEGDIDDLEAADTAHFADDTAHGNPLGALALHEATLLDAGAHGLMERTWIEHGTTGLTRVVMTQDGANSFVASVTDRWLTITAQGSGGNQREAFLLPDSDAEDSELVSLLGPADTLAPGVAQWWHLHRVVEVSPGVWRAFAVWTDTTIPLPTLLNLNVVEFTGAASMSFNPGGINSALATALDTLRYCPITRARRAGGVVTAHTPVPWLPKVGDTGNLVNMAATGFNITGATVTAVDQTRRTFAWAQAGSDATDADAGGTWEPATRTATIPHMLATRLIGNTLYAKQWRPEEPEPDWADPGRVFAHTISAGSPAPPTGEGVNAVAAAHMQTPNRLRFGGTRSRRL